MRDEDRYVYLGPSREPFGGPITQPEDDDTPLNESYLVSFFFILMIRDHATCLHLSKTTSMDTGFLQYGQWYELVSFDVTFWDQFVWAIERNANLIRPGGQESNPEAPAVGWLEVRIEYVDLVYTVGVIMRPNTVRLEMWPCNSELQPPNPWDKRPQDRSPAE